MNEIKAKMEAEKNVGELSKKIDAEKRTNDRIFGNLETDIREGRDTAKSASDLKYSSKRLESLDKERQRELSKLR